MNQEKRPELTPEQVSYLQERTAFADARTRVIKTVGRQTTTLSEGARKSHQEADGGKAYLKLALEGLGSVFARVDEDLRKEQGSPFQEFPEPLAVAKLVKRYLMLVQGSLDNLLIKTETDKANASGRLKAYENVTQYVEGLMTTELKNLRELEAAILRGDVQVEPAEPGGTVVPIHKSGGRPPGVRPANNIAARREGEDAVDDLTQRRRAAKASKPAKNPVKKVAKKARGKDASNT
jgi:hypothetical protein